MLALRGTGTMGQVRRALTWVLALPLIVVGSQVAHGLAYWWAYPIASVRDAILAHSGHGYLSYAPMLLSFLAGLAVAGAARARLGRAARQRRS